MHAPLCAKPRKVTSLLDQSEHMLEENNGRTGFVDEAQYKDIGRDNGLGQLWLRAILALGYTYGFRKPELLNLLKVGQVDLLARTVRLNPRHEKRRRPYRHTHRSVLPPRRGTDERSAAGRFPGSPVPAWSPWEIFARCGPL